MKKCPFKKTIHATKRNPYQGSSVLDDYYEEDFDMCIGNRCMAYSSKYEKPYYDAQEEVLIEECLLMRRNSYDR